MTRHLVRVCLFLALQLSLYGLLSHSTESPVHVAVVDPDPSAHYPPAPSLAEFLKSRIRPIWEKDPDIIRTALAAGARQGLLADLINDYRTGPDRYVCAARDKSRRLQNTPGRKLILIGGSNLAFSLDSQILADRYGITPVNMGLHAGLGPRFMTGQVVGHVKDGDVVIVAMEPSVMIEGLAARRRIEEDLCHSCPEFEPLFAEPPSVWERWTSTKTYADREALAELSKNSRTRMLHLFAGSAQPTELSARPSDTNGGKDSAKESLRRARLERQFDRQIGPLLRIAQRRYDGMIGIYQRTTFNEFGDATHHRPLTFRAQHLIADFNFVLDDETEPKLRESIDLLNDFGEYCESCGAKVYFAYTPIPPTDVAREFAARYEPIMNESLEFPILFPIRRSFTRPNELFDTTAHLNWEGSLRRTGVLCEALDRHLKPTVRLPVDEQLAMRDRAVRPTAMAGGSANTATIR
jgi:hypothetical protein